MLKSLTCRLFRQQEDEASRRLLDERSLDQWKQEPIDKYKLVYWVCCFFFFLKRKERERELMVVRFISCME